ncbi:MAG: SIS domain-containing protein, partial [Actinobacteria bacterium]|nr:SIS domain-containing protein [Actinomycetota bacterium]
MSTNLGEIMRSEIAEIPAVFQKLADQIPTITKQINELSLNNIDSVILVARGTSDNAALFLKYLIETKIGIPCGLASPSVVTIYKSNLRFTNCLVIGISQSGQSPDIVTYTKAAKAGGAKSISLTNDPESPLAKATDLHLYLEAGAEKAVAATKSYSAELLLSYILVSAWAKQPINLDSLISATKQSVSDLPKVSAIVNSFDHKSGITTMGRGFAYANAQECALKIQETLKIPVSSFSSADYLHGPISSLTENSRVIFLTPTGVSVESMDKTVNRIREITKHIYWIGSGFPTKTGEIQIGGATGLSEQESV